MTVKDVNTLDMYDNTTQIQHLLEHFNPFIVRLARKRFPRALVPPDLWNLEMDELVQNVRIKLWKALQKGQVNNLAPYVSRIVLNESIDLARKYKREHTFPLLLNDDGELYEGKILVADPQGIQDPCDELESKESLVNCITKMMSHLKKLPSRQRIALICLLKDQAEDISLLRTICIQYEVDIEAVQWPEEKEELRRLHASLSIARKKLRLLISERGSHTAQAYPSEN